MSGDLFPITAALTPSFDYRTTTGSTNSDLLALADGLPDGAVVASLGQTAGRGRLDRAWASPSGQTLAASVLFRPRTADGARLPAGSWGWFPLLAGTALRGAVRELLPDADVTLKWPNDVQIRGLKVSGLLAELVVVDGEPDAVVIGSGINLTIPAGELPTSSSTSLALEGVSGDAPEIADAVFGAYLERLRSLVEVLAASGGAGVHEEVASACGTLGRRVRVELPDGTRWFGVAKSLDDGGRLVVLEDDSAEILVVAAGDVTHLRYE